LTGPAAKWRLAWIWFSGAGIVFVILVGQSLAGYYEPRTQDAWSWFLPTVMPTLALIVGVLVSDLGQERGDAPVPAANRALFGLGAAFSLLYLLLVALSILIQPFLQTPPLEVMHRSNLWLGPFQGLTAGALAAFFHRRC
jgi:hypothetical protein